MNDKALLEVLKMAKIGAIIRVNPETTLQVVSLNDVGIAVCEACHFSKDTDSFFLSGKCINACSTKRKECVFMEVPRDTKSTANRSEYTLFNFNLKADYRYE